MMTGIKPKWAVWRVPDFDFVFHRSSSDGVLSFVTSNLYHCEAHLLYLLFSCFQVMRLREGKKKVRCPSSHSLAWLID